MLPSTFPTDSRIFCASHGALYCGDALAVLKTLPAESVQCCVTSPPYWGLRDYGAEGQIGLEDSPQEHISSLVSVFREVHRVLKNDGVLWVNYGDTYSFSADKSMWKPHGKQASNQASLKLGLKRDKSLPPKNLLGLPWRLAFALQDEGWFLRQDIIWNKPNPMPESVRDRCTKAHEYIFLLSKSPKYYFDCEGVAEPVAASTVSRLAQPNLARQLGSFRIPGKTNGPMKAVGGSETRNRRSVWTIPSYPCAEAHFATFPPKLAETCILAGSRPGDVVLDPFMGSGTSGMVARNLGRKWLGIELNPTYCDIALKRIDVNAPRLTDLLQEETAPQPFEQRELRKETA